jgi:hypothetical protein
LCRGRLSHVRQHALFQRDHHGSAAKKRGLNLWQADNRRPKGISTSCRTTSRSQSPVRT